MFPKFYELFNALNKEALERADEDLKLIEDAQKGLVDAWTDYMLSCETEPTTEELRMYTECAMIVLKF